MKELSVPLAAVFLSVYAAIAVLIGIRSARRETEDDFMISSRRVAGVRMVATMTAGIFDGAALSIYIAYVYQFGFSAIWFFLGIALGFLLFRHFAPRLKARADEVKAYSMPEYFLHVLGKRNAIMFSVFLVLQFFGYLVLNFIISGKVLSHIFPFMPYPVAALVGGFVILTYLLLAGFKAVVNTDFYQLVIMVVMTLTVGAALGGATRVASGHLDIFGMGAGNIIAFVVLAAPGVMVAPDLWQRLFAARDVRNARLGFGYAALLLPLLATIITVIGLATKQAFPTIAPQDALVTGFAALLPGGIKEFGLVLLYAVALSSSDTVTFVVSSIITRDLKNYSARFSDESMRKMTRVLMVVFVMAAMLVATSYQQILDLGFSLLSLNLALFPVVFASMFWRVREAAVFWSLVMALGSVALLVASQKLTPETAVISLPVALGGLLVLHFALRTGRRVGGGAGLEEPEGPPRG